MDYGILVEIIITKLKHFMNVVKCSNKITVNISKEPASKRTTAVTAESSKKGMEPL